MSLQEHSTATTYKPGAWEYGQLETLYKDIKPGGDNLEFGGKMIVSPGTPLSYKVDIRLFGTDSRGNTEDLEWGSFPARVQLIYMSKEFTTSKRGEQKQLQRGDGYLTASFEETLDAINWGDSLIVGLEFDAGIIQYKSKQGERTCESTQIAYILVTDRPEHVHDAEYQVQTCTRFSRGDSPEKCACTVCVCQSK